MNVRALLLATALATIAGCPSNDEVKREPDDGAGEPRTGEAETEAPKPSV